MKTGRTNHLIGATIILIGICAISCNSNYYRSYGWRPLEIRHTILIYDPNDTSQTQRPVDRTPNLWTGYQMLRDSVASTTQWIMLYASWKSSRFLRTPIDRLDPNDHDRYDIVIELYLDSESDLDSLLRSPGYLEFINLLREGSLEFTTYTVLDPGSGISIRREPWD